MPFLPIGRQYLASILKDNSVYVDKTEYIYHLCMPVDSSYFLSRPRRFGKSLTLDTISELFSGNRALFEGLWIEDKWDWSQTYPVIRLSLDKIGHEDGLSNALVNALKKIAVNFGLTIDNTNPGLAFSELIEKKKTPQQIRT